MDMRLEVVVLPVSDVDRAKKFYQGLGWRLDGDYPFNENFRVVQLTPPGSASSIIFGKGVTTATPGSADGLHLVWTTSTRLGPSWLDAAPRSARYSTMRSHRSTMRAPHNGSLVRPRITRATAHGSRSPTRTATAGSSRKSPFACPAARHRHSRSMARWPAWPLRSVVPRRHMASMSKRSAGATRTGPTGTLSTWWMSRRNRTRRHERVAVNRSSPLR
jgi:catechol 2,3-dioxygenase-like lactoylglutathione lyase family enzyme